MILLIDNYDSFSYNLYQLIGEIEPDIRVIRNDELTVEKIREMAPDRIILSPGPGRPEDAGVICRVAAELGKEIPILGVCLGHQAICAAFGATITYARKLMHGKQSEVRFDPECPLFAGCPETAPVARYHSLAADPATMPDCLKVTAVTVPEHQGAPDGGQTGPDCGNAAGGGQIEPARGNADGGEVMAVQHREYPIFGVQFHPESIMTPDGKRMLENFIRYCG